MLNGPRQSGKTTLVKGMAAELGMGYLSLDDQETLNLAKEDPKNFLSFYAKKPLVIDEVQFAPGLIPYIKSYVDEINQRGMFLLTGSADFIKMHKVTESLAGRMVRYSLYPFATSELQPKKANIIDQLFSDDLSEPENYSSLENLMDIIIRGGYPEILNLDYEFRDDWFASYIESRVQKDILEYKNISFSKLHLVKTLLRLLAAYDSELVNYNNIAKKIQVDNKTVLSYISLLEAMYIVKLVPSYHVNPSLKVVKSPKVHFLDTGFAGYLLHVDKENLFKFKDAHFGRLIETFVFCELLKEADFSKQGVDIYHFRDLRKKEVDLVLENRDGNIIGVEVKAKASLKKTDFKGMLELARVTGARFLKGIVFYGGDEVRPFSVDGQVFYCIPLGTLGESCITGTRRLT